MGSGFRRERRLVGMKVFICNCLQAPCCLGFAAACCAWIDPVIGQRLEMRASWLICCIAASILLVAYAHAADLDAAQVRAALAATTPGHPADLSGKSLRNLDLSRFDFSGANLAHADLFAAKLEEANFAGANLSRANLNRAWIMRA